MQDAPAAGPHVVRWANARAVLDVLRRAESALTVSELIEHTGLTRATVIAVGEDLVRRGWAAEPPLPRGAGPQKGRPARRFAFRADAGIVLGIDLGAAKTTVLVADLLGTPLASASSPMPGAVSARGDDPASDAVPPPAPAEDGADGGGTANGTAAGGTAGSHEQRIATVAETALTALARAGRSPADVLAAGAGLAAPVDRAGRVVGGQAFWRQFDLGLAEAFAQRFGWQVLLENDANLAVLAERWRGAAQGVEDVAVLLAGERVGAGVLESGRLLRGHGGGFGELAFLTMVDGVGRPAGIAQLAREWGADAVAAGRLAPSDGAGTQAVFSAAAAGDQTAQEILERIAAAMARIIAILSTLVNPELVVVGGAVASAARRLLPSIRAHLDGLTVTPARVEVSPLGADAVTLGAVRRALDDVAARALEITLKERGDPLPQ
ncbi:ROK family transcriptional regulator [Sinomonas halotolerans]|uniref:ROK family transcriptional regulator n=1 Tax=Sinomonas halotolerans TaxID=1644133 RepID=A0ABU9WY62_9MICC